jgi:hypothetical protein
VTRSLSLDAVCCLLPSCLLFAKDKPPQQAVEALVEASCIECHDADTNTALDFDVLAFDLGDADAYRTWVNVFDMIESGKMPPEKEPRPDPRQKRAALNWLRSELRQVSLAEQQKNGRVRVRRLTAREFEYSLHDLLGIKGDLARFLPPESRSGRFDTVADGQGMSPLHIRSYLAAADAALDEAIELGPRPRTMDQPHRLSYRNSPYMKMWLERPLRRGGNTATKTEDAMVFFDGRPADSLPHLTRSDHMGWRFPAPGRYRIDCQAYASQARTPVTLCIYRSSELAGKAKLVATWQLDPGKPRILSVEHYFCPGDFIHVAPADLDWDDNGRNVLMVGAREGYSGEGVAVRGLTITGPIESEWPPTRTR